jgi:hypothetical protein
MTSDNSSHMIQSCEDSDDPPPPPPQRARAAVFFDGTGNNRQNARTRDTDHLSYADQMTGNTASYGSAPSNVAKGEESTPASITTSKALARRPVGGISRKV